MLIALSAGGINSELNEHSVSEEEVQTLLVDMATRLLQAGHRLAFGGTLGVVDQPLTAQLIQVCESYLNARPVSRVEQEQPETWPLVNYSAWPHYQKISTQQRDRLVGICKFVEIAPAIDSPFQWDDLKEPADVKLYGAYALSAMRVRMALDTNLRVVWGGRIAGAAGWMAGVLEEIYYTLEQEKPVLILGGFGGCARLIAEFLAQENASWPDRLSLTACADAERDSQLSTEQRLSLQDRFAKVQRRLTDYRHSLFSNPQTNGLPSQLLRDALFDNDPKSVVNMAASVAANLQSS